MELIITSDGSCRPKNPGPMHLGVLIRTNDGIVKSAFHKAIGKGTNNIAEYSAVLLGVAVAKKLGGTSLIIEVDSQLVAMQMHGHYRVKQAELKKLVARLHKELETFENWEFKWAARNVGARPIADALSRNSMTEAERLIHLKYPFHKTGGLSFWDDIRGQSAEIGIEDEFFAASGAAEGDLDESE